MKVSKVFATLAMVVLTVTLTTDALALGGRSSSSSRSVSSSSSSKSYRSSSPSKSSGGLFSSSSSSSSKSSGGLFSSSSSSSSKSSGGLFSSSSSSSSPSKSSGGLASLFKSNPTPVAKPAAFSPEVYKFKPRNVVAPVAAGATVAAVTANATPAKEIVRPTQPVSSLGGVNGKTGDAAKNQLNQFVATANNKSQPSVVTRTVTPAPVYTGGTTSTIPTYREPIYHPVPVYTTQAPIVYRQPVTVVNNSGDGVTFLKVVGAIVLLFIALMIIVAIVDYFKKKA